jgi:hypothetical protein
MSFWWLLAYVVVASLSLVALFVLGREMLVGWSTPPRVLLMACMAGLVVLEILSFVLLLIFVVYFKLYVGPDSLRGFNFWGLYREVAWVEMLAARPVNFLGLRYLRVPATGLSAPLWIPLFLNDPERFCLRVRQYAGPEHPLAVALHEEMIGQG